MVKLNRKRNGFTLLELTILFAIILVLLAIDIPTNKYGSENTRRKACFTNQRNLLGAIEMYNMDHSDKIQVLNDETIEMLIKEKHLKGSLSDFVCPETRYNGKYLSLGNILENGVTYCEYHGTLDGIEIKPGMTFKDYLEERERRAKKDTQKSLKNERIGFVRKIAFIGFIISLIGSLVCGIIKIIKKTHKK